MESLYDRARAQAVETDRHERSNGSSSNWLIAPPAPHRNLKDLPPAAKTELERKMGAQLEAIVVLSVERRQEGTQMVTVYRTNKGLFCSYSTLIQGPAMRGTPGVTTFGSCGP